MKITNFLRCASGRLMKMKLAGFALILFSVCTVNAQSVTVKGEITSKDDGLGLPGASVVVKGTSNSAATDIDGSYSITANANDVLVFSYIGFTPQEIKVGTNTTLNVVLVSEATTLDDVVVIGYGTQKKADITGSVAVVDVGEVLKVSNSDVSQLLQGRSAGVNVTSDGQPGAAPNIRIRGIGTFGDNQPLYVVDGVPVGTSVRDFNPNDIKSIQVLKDASAGAIYGSRAANGVVIITTKRGVKNSPLKIDYSGYYGVDQVAQKIPVLGRQDYQMIVNEKRTNAGLPLIAGNDPSSDLFVDNIDNDWQKIGLKDGTRKNHSFNFSGGGENVTYNASMDYFENKGMFVGNGPSYERYSGRINVTIEKGIFKMSPSLYYTHSFENSLTFRGDVLTGGRPPLINDLVIAIPTMALYDENNIGGYGGTDSTIHQTIALNVPGINSLFTNSVEVDRTFAIINPEFKLINSGGHELTYKLNLSYDKTQARDFSFVPKFEMGYFFGSGKSLLDDNSRIYTTTLVENTINYKKVFGKHDVDVLVGQTYQTNDAVTRTGHSENLPEPYHPVLSNGSNQTSGGSLFNSTLASLLGRVTYSFDDRYLLTATVRRDGSSRFAASNRYGTFPSVALGWKLSNEKFFKVSKDIVSQIKLRGSYGELGNQNIGDYLFQPVINGNILYNFNGATAVGGLQTSVVDENIKWETTTSANIGLDASFLNDALSFTVEYYNKKTTDVLVGVPIPLSTGSINTTPVVNAGSLRNTGIDIEVGYHYDKGKDFSFDISANASTLKNEVLALGGNNEPIYGTGSKTQVGGKVGEHFGYVYEGLFQSNEEVADHAFQSAATAPGDVKFKDLNDDGVIDADDRTFLGSAIPTVTYGFNFAAKYKNLDFTVFASGAAGYYINSSLYRSLMWSTDYINSHEDILDRWTPENTDTNIPRVVANDPNGNARDSNRPGWLQKGDYLRINTVSLGYTLPNLFGKVIQSIRIYSTVQNLYTFTKYKGFNPDFNAGVFNPGFDGGTYPRPRTYLFGVQMTF
ncbi:TonB-dependent receptor [Flavobacterium subsaxonicum WB 4.1-42 = DSM 21790]|uniref:TonB-dependent receptor n=1 Tax=Flavobacterium subsaxonicum WB 4.1-42 = DSM 21790 TaxID=1121898 RepID=A0A0A2MSF7_9FLAO|nr:TonB-dependent receptor [Flavobacterium subsaxonicum WB 4.1-42 = DSM 21790]